ncbi:MAG TPA: hypothetical protein VKE50_09070, partial [Thermoanaerobaculia bacterium]|nr:hypothetical protein [Thermoanaerobaculia bacterium]
MRRLAVLFAALMWSCASQRSAAPTRAAGGASAAAEAEVAREQPVETDEYTRYELLAPESASFHI